MSHIDSTSHATSTNGTRPNASNTNGTRPNAGNPNTSNTNTTAHTALAVLDLVAESVAALDSGGRADVVAVPRMAEALGADSAAVLHLRPGMPIVVTYSWPTPRAATSLALAFDDRPLIPVRGALIRTRHTPSVLAGLVDPARGTTIAFTRARPFGASDARTWEYAQRPLTIVWAHAEHQRRAAHPACRHVVETPHAVEDLLMTPREIEVLTLLAQGLVATAIARTLTLSPRTVHKHLGSIYRKLGVSDRLLAVTVAQQKGLISARFAG